MQTKTEQLLTAGTRVRHRRFPELQGVVKEIRPTIEGGFPSVFPYLVKWDELGHANQHFDPRYSMFMAADEIEAHA